MSKPIEKYPTGKMWIWHEIEDYWKECFDTDFRSVSMRPYRDFWHFILDHTDISNESRGYLWRDVMVADQRYKEEEWVRVRVDWLFEQFDEGDGEITAWFEW